MENRRKLTEWTLMAVVTLTLGIAGIAVSGQYQWAVWVGCAASIAASIAWGVTDYNDLKYKTPLTAMAVCVFLIAALILHSLVASSQETKPAPVSVQHETAPATGNASTKGDQSPAVSGSGNVISIGGSDTKPKKGKTQ